MTDLNHDYDLVIQTFLKFKAQAQLFELLKLNSA